MHIYEKDYRYLLLNIIPQHRLSPGLRRDVTSALKSGESDELRRESLRALEALCDVEYFERTNVDRSDGEVLVAYRRLGGSYRVTLQVPAKDWLLVGSDGETPRIANSTPIVTDTTAPDAATADTTSTSAPIRKGPTLRSSNAVEFLPEIIRTFAITDRECLHL